MDLVMVPGLIADTVRSSRRRLQWKQQQMKTGTAMRSPSCARYSRNRSAYFAADHRDEAHAAAGRATEVVGQPQLRILDLTRARFAAQLQPHLVHHAQARGADRMPERL